jgi:hypothetical protein
MKRILLSIAVLALAPAFAALAADRPPTAEERTRIEGVLRAAGFTAWEEIELDDGVWEIDDAVGADGRRYDVKLNQAFEIIAREPD